VRVDNDTAGLLDARFEVVSDSLGMTLRSERAELEGARTLLGRETPCVGRIRELGFLEAIFEETCADDTANVVLVSGPAGIGKSRLRYEFLRNAQGKHEVQLWLGRGEVGASGAPFSMLAPCIRHAAGILEGEPMETKLKKLRSRIARFSSLSEVDRVSKFLAEMLGLRTVEDDDPQIAAARNDPVLMHDQMRQAWEDFLAAELGQHPVLLVLEDLQWGDLPSVRFIDDALKTMADRPLMVLALARPEVHEVFPTLWRERAVTKMELSELSSKASWALVDAVLGDEVDEATAEKMIKLAAGNAFYLEELIRAVAQGAKNELPNTVLAMATARIENLHPESRRVLRAAAVFGRAFTPSGVEQLLGGPDEAPNVGRRLARLAQNEVISKLPDPPKSERKQLVYESHYAFRNDLVREAAYSMLTEEDRVLGHRLAAEWLEANEDVDAFVLADHYDRGGEPGRAIRWFRIAAEQALDGNDVDAALRHAERGARCGATGEELGMFRLFQAEGCRWLGRHRDSFEHAEQARSLIRRGSAPWYQAIGLSAMAAGNIGDWNELVDIAQMLIDLAPADAVIGYHLVASARTADRLLSVGSYELAESLIGRIEDAAWHPQAKSPVILAWLHRLRGYRSLFFGEIGAFLRDLKEAGERFDEAAQTRNALLQRGAVGYGYLKLGWYRHARNLLSDVRDQAAHLDLHNVVATTEAYLGLAQASLGALGEARHTLDHAIKLAEEQGNPQVEGAAKCSLARVLLMMDEPDAAETAARAAIEVLDIYQPAKTTALAICANVLLKKEDFEAALETAEDALELLESLGGIADGESLVRLVHAEALHGMGEVGAAASAIAVAKERVNERAELIEDDELRGYFLEEVKENVRTSQLALEWAEHY
jgi:tetratricopeptide (TPR) repeat protein